jgi:hypothetical protein
MTMITSIEDSELHENMHRDVSMYELPKNDIEGTEKNHDTYDTTVCFIPGNKNTSISVNVCFV